MRLFKALFTGLVLASAIAASAQDTAVHVRSARVLATDPDALAVFYEKAFGMSQTRLAANSPTLKEIVINSGATLELASKAASAAKSGENLTYAFVKDPDGSQNEMVMSN